MTRATTHISLASLVFVVSSALGLMFFNFSSPYGSRQLWILSAAYVLVFLWVFSLVFFFGYFFRSLFWKIGTRHEFAKSATRQGVLLGLLAVILLMLQASSLLTFSISVLLFAVFILIEFYAR